MKREESLQIAVCKYLKMQYPKVLFTFESAGINLPVWIAKKMSAQRSCKGLPDLMILQPNKLYHGLFLELKPDRSKVFKRNGELKSNQHINEQNEVLERLKASGYYARFACGFDDAKRAIDTYLSNSY